MDHGNGDKKANRTKNCAIKKVFKFNDYKSC